MSTILLVDDDPDNLWALRLALEDGGHRVVIARNGVEALKKLHYDIPQLIVTDWEMPAMNGVELCERIRCHPAWAHIPVVMLSAMPEPAEGETCWTAFFRKPANLDTLMRTVDAFAAERIGRPRAAVRADDRAPSRWQSVNPRCWP